MGQLPSLSTTMIVVLAMFFACVLNSAYAADKLVGQKGRFKFWQRSAGLRWHEARDACIEDGGWLAVDLSQETHNSLTGVPGGGPYAWLGGHDADKEGVWRWVTGPAGKEDNGRGRVFWMAPKVSGTKKAECLFQACFWQVGEPNDWDGEDYLMTWKDILWNDMKAHKSDKVKHYYCEYPVPPEPPAAEAKNYQLFSRPNGISWYEARQTCTVFGGILASELDVRNKAFITELGKTLTLNKGTAFLGGTDYSVRGEWRWITGAAQEEDNNRGRLFYKKPKSGSAKCHSPSSVGCRWAASNPVTKTNPSFLAIKQTGNGIVEWVGLTYPATATGFVCEFPITATGSPSVTPSHSSSQTVTTTLPPTVTQSNTTDVKPTQSPSMSSTHSGVTPSPSLVATPTRSLPTTTTKTATTSMSLVGVATATQTSSLPLPPRLPPPKQKKANVGVVLAGSETTGTVVVSAAGGANAVVSTLGSGGAGVVVVAGSAVRLMECGLAGEDIKPARYELPIQFALGTGPMRYFAGAVLAHTALQFVLLLLPLEFRRRSKTRSSSEDNTGTRGEQTTSNAVQYTGMFFCGSHGFFTGTILGGCMTIMLHHDGDWFIFGIGATCAAVVISMHILIVAAVHLAPTKGLVTRIVPPIDGRAVKLRFLIDANKVKKGCSFSAAATHDVLITLFDGSRIFEKMTHRHYASVEITLASVTAMISGARPSQNCDAAAIAIGLLATIGLFYVILVRPFRTRLDIFFSLINNVVLVALSFSVIVALKTTEDGEEPPQWSMKTIEACIWAISGTSFVQVLVQGYWAYHISQRRKLQDVDGKDDFLAFPLLQFDTKTSSTSTSDEADSDEIEQNEKANEDGATATETESNSSDDSNTSSSSNSDDDGEGSSSTLHTARNPLRNTV